MKKLSRVKAASVLSQVPDLLDSMSTEIETLRAKLASRDKEDRIRKIAQSMESKGLDAGIPMEEKIAKMKGLPDDRLAVIEEATKMSAPKVSTFRLMEDDSRGDSKSTSSAAAARYLEVLGSLE